MTIPIDYTGKAIWSNKDHDIPIVVTGYAGEDQDGREYFNTDNGHGAIPGDEIKITSKLYHALDLAKKGFFVFPLHDYDAVDKDGEPLGKKPRETGWEEKATTDPAKIKQWWNKWPNANIGIAAGKSGYLIIDIDPDKGGSIDLLPLSPDELKTVAQKTGKGGEHEHYFYKQPKNALFGNGNTLPTGIDARGDGGYIVGPGSIHPENGEMYAWKAGQSPDEIKALPLPYALGQYLKPKGGEPTTKRSETTPKKFNGDCSPYAKRAFEDELNKLASTPNGDRNNQLNNSAFALGTLVGAGELDENEVIAELSKVASEIGLGERETMKTINSGLTAGKKTPRDIPTPSNHSTPKQQETPKQTQPKPDEKQTDENNYIFKRYSMADVINRPDKAWLVEQIFGPGDIGMIFGDSGSKKTFIIIDLIISCLLAQPFADNFKVSKPLTIAYATDEGLDGLGNRFRAALKKYNVPLDDERLKNFSFFEVIPQLFDEGMESHITRFVQDYKLQVGETLDLLIIDTLANASLGSEEKSNDNANIIASHAKWARKELNCVVSLVHHTTKTGETYRGASAYKGHCDFMVQVETHPKDETKSIMSHYKLREGKPWEPLECTLLTIPDHYSPIVEWKKHEAGSRDTNGDKILQAMFEYPNQKMTVKQWAEIVLLDLSEKALLNEFKRLHEKELVKRGLREPNKPNSKSNPFVYWLGDF